MENNLTKEKMENGYACVPNRIAFDKNIKNEVGLLIIISSLCASTGECWATNEKLGELIDCDTSNVSKKIKKLVDNNYISVRYQKTGKDNMTTIRYITLTDLSRVNKNTKLDIGENTKLDIGENTKYNNTITYNNTIIYNNNSNELVSKDNKIENFLSNLQEDWYLLLKDWIEYRKSIKKPLKDVSYLPCYEKLVELSRDDIVIAQKIVEQSKANGWQGLFELKQAKQFYSTKSKADKGEQAMDNIRSMFEEGMKEKW